MSNKISLSPTKITPEVSLAYPNGWFPEDIWTVILEKLKQDYQRSQFGSRDVRNVVCTINRLGVTCKTLRNLLERNGDKNLYKINRREVELYEQLAASRDEGAKPPNRWRFKHSVRN